MSMAVVDASVAVKWFVPEELSDRADALAASGWTIMAPRLLLVEVANTFWKKMRRDLMQLEDAREHLAALPRFFDNLFEYDDVVVPALELSRAFDHPVYDFIYLLGARRRDAVFVTADQRLLLRIQGSPQAAHVVHLSDWSPGRP